MRELILGGQKSGKSSAAEARARAWLAATPAHRAVLIATGLAHDAEMQARIARHQADRAARVPQMLCVEEPFAIAQRLQEHSNAQTLVVLDCLTMWLTNLRMPASISEEKRPAAPVEYALAATESIASLLQALQAAPGPVVIVSNEIGLGVTPLGAQVRAFVDELGQLNQAVARTCERVTFMAAGCALSLKGAA